MCIRDRTWPVQLQGQGGQLTPEVESLGYGISLTLSVRSGARAVEMLPLHFISPNLHHRQRCYNMANAPVAVELQGQGGQVTPVLEVKSLGYISDPQC